MGVMPLPACSVAERLVVAEVPILASVSAIVTVSLEVMVPLGGVTPCTCKGAPPARIIGTAKVTGTTAVAELLAATVSSELVLTLHVLVSVPTLSGAAVMTTTAMLPGGMVPKAHCTVSLLATKLPCDGATETNCKPASENVPTVTTALLGPRLVTDKV